MKKDIRRFDGFYKCVCVCVREIPELVFKVILEFTRELHRVFSLINFCCYLCHFHIILSVSSPNF